MLADFTVCLLCCVFKQHSGRTDISASAPLLVSVYGLMSCIRPARQKRMMGDRMFNQSQLCLMRWGASRAPESCHMQRSEPVCRQNTPRTPCRAAFHTGWGPTACHLPTLMTSAQWITAVNVVRHNGFLRTSKKLDPEDSENDFITLFLVHLSWM